jgi:tetratricopeptide (TPR) repeat protein
MRRLYLLIFIFVLITLNTFSQAKKDLKKTFVNAEFSILYEEYREALPLFLEIYNAGRKDANISHRIGLCYLNIPNQKNKAVKYLEEAIKDISTSYKPGYYTESKAPIETYYYLGIAYRITNRLNEAIEAFNKYKQHLDPNDIANFSRVDAQLKACYNAIELLRTPTNLIETNLGKNINSEYSNIHPLVSSDEETIVFMSELRFYDGIFFSKKRDGRWLPARNISLEFNSEQPLKPVFLSVDGTKLFLQRNDNDDINLYFSTYENGVWSQVQKLNSNINTSSSETFACTTFDGKTLYYTSNRPGGFGGFDLYKSELDASGEWASPLNLGSTINSAFDETTPFITEDGKTLYFSSEGHFNIGGFDIFTSQKNGENWDQPENLGFPFNTTDDDVFFFPLKNGEIAYYSKFKPTGFGEFDIYRIQIFSREDMEEREEEIEQGGFINDTISED